MIKMSIQDDLFFIGFYWTEQFSSYIQFIYGLFYSRLRNQRPKLITTANEISEGAFAEEVCILINSNGSYSENTKIETIENFTSKKDVGL